MQFKKTGDSVGSLTRFLSSIYGQLADLILTFHLSWTPPQAHNAVPMEAGYAADGK